VPWSGLQTQLMERTPGENASGESSTKNIIEAVRLGVFTPPGSPFDRHSIVVFPLSMNNPAEHCAKNAGCRLLKRSQRRDARKIDERRRTYQYVGARRI